MENEVCFKFVQNKQGFVPFLKFGIQTDIVFRMTFVSVFLIFWFNIRNFFFLLRFVVFFFIVRVFVFFLLLTGLLLTFVLIL